MPDYKTKRFTFWRAHFTPEPYSRTLQQLLKSAFDNTKIRHRLLSLDGEENYFRFINYKMDLNGYFCSNFFGYEKGRIGQVIKEAFDADQIDPSALPLPPAADGTDQQFLDGKLYFVCFGDRLVLAQDIHLRAKHLERYLNEMLHRRSTLFSSRRTLLLEPSISLRVRDQVKGVKGISLSAPLSYNSPNRSQEEIQQSRLIPSGQSWEAIKAFFGNTLDFTQFETDGFINPKDIEVSLYLSWKRKREERVSDQLDTLANTFRHVGDEMDIEVETHSGKIKHNELRLNKAQSVIYRNDLPDAGDIFEKMINWYEELVEEQDI